MSCDHEEMLAGKKFVCIQTKDPHPELGDGRPMHFMVREEYANDRSSDSV
jgi:hypothetical protein